ncbi:Glutamyl-tRNA(Gln) amidotransferase subunit A [Aquisphaera giovannonii]|uniref:Glutamyl-tRNA(Gln) amidotransferase subunit A n=1 Tax=Aquisphaera giovannonii TaxID=406548 RepID=A0A5B9VXS5_9BACT|nr:amidase [Aquisphaera giovannonii]QEH32585.1 Glutamyl-tRNA(Gln) amidotransferase subunit A [Aquisphaera giovannonii]
MGRRAAIGALGVGTATFRRALAAQAAQAGAVTAEMVRQAEWIAGLSLTDGEREQAVAELKGTTASFRALREVAIPYDVPPALSFVPAPGLRPASGVSRGGATPITATVASRPAGDEELAFLPVSELAGLVRTREVTSTELTKLYLARLRRFDPVLKCVVTLTEDLAMKQAAAADAEIAAGKYRGPLHGIPWGAKDLIAYPGYPTGWGAPQFKGRVIDEKATVAARLEEAGAVLVAKLSLGALAMGDRWYGGQTRSPWDPRRGSSGSSAGSASAVAAGLVGFAIGSETLGSIVSPSRACGTSGLRPTFGRVSRHGCMALSWSMDKIGPIARSIEDCALVFDAIHGHDGLDATAVDQPFAWPPKADLSGLRIGYVEDPQRPADRREELHVLKSLGLDPRPIELPRDVPARDILIMLTAECAAAFDELTRNHVTEGLNEWPATFLEGQFIPAVEYLRASRARTLLMRSMARLMEAVDVYVGAGDDLVITNLTGHPTAVFPGPLRDINGRPGPRSVTLTGRLHDESTLLAVAHAYQQATGHHRVHPPLERFLAEQGEATIKPVS